jgi:hypothetical protein
VKNQAVEKISITLAILLFPERAGENRIADSLKKVRPG